MKKLILALITLLSFNVSAQTLEAKSFDSLINEVKNAKFTYKETGMVFGYISISSCLYLSEDIAVFKNYCFPAREYPAKGYTIISKKYGIVDLYQETAGDLIKRDIQISQFPEILDPYLSTALPLQTLGGLSSMMEKMYYRFFPGCWSTNFSFYTESTDVNCTVPAANVVGFNEWSTETQSIVNDIDSWNALLKTVETSIKK